MQRMEMWKDQVYEVLQFGRAWLSLVRSERAEHLVFFFVLYCIHQQGLVREVSELVHGV